MESFKKLLLANKAWVQDRLSIRPDFFTANANDQKPEFLWIGCSDSRVPAEEITGAEPGELFVHRNIANLVVPTDFNLLSVLQYAVEVLKVRHVIVCGHYHCGGVRNALTNQDLGIINQWLHPIKDLYEEHRKDLDIITDPAFRDDRLVELHTIKQIRNLTHTSIIQRAWHEMNQPMLHGWIYDLRTGRLKEVARVEPGGQEKTTFTYDYKRDSTGK